jgi:hypothetical protein
MIDKSSYSELQAFPRFLVLILALTFSIVMGSCDAQSPSETKGYPEAPRFLEQHHLVAGVADSSFALSGMSLAFTKEGFPRRISAGSKTLIDSASVSVSGDDVSKYVPKVLVPTALERKSYLCRTSGRATFGDAENSIATLENATESFFQSPRIYSYTRLVCRQAGVVSLKFRMVVSNDYDTSVGPTAGVLHPYTKKNLPISTFLNGVSSSLQCIASHTKEGVGIFFHPADPELRRWFKDDYLVIMHLKRSLHIAANPDGTIAVDVSIDSVNVNAGETIDQYFTFVNLGPDDNRITNYISPSMADYYGRYNPVEGYSTHWYGKKNGFEDIHDDAYTWGFTTYARPFMEFYLHSNQDSLHGYFREEMIRHFDYFLERSNQYGLLPYTILPKSLISQTKNAKKIYTDFMFAQAGVGDVEFARDFVPSLPSEEAVRVYQQVARLRTLYDPKNPLSWTIIMPSGAYWFDYSNLWKSEGNSNTIINTHVTAFRIAVDMRALSHRLGQSADYDFWDDIVRKGTDGLLWFVQDQKNWGKGESGKRELNYKVGQAPHGEYHKTITEDLVDVVNAGLIDYRKDEIVKALSLY